MKAIILAAGLGTRMRQVSTSKPKPMMCVRGKPLIFFAVENLKNAGITEIVINVAWKSSEIIDCIGDGKRFGVDIKYSLEGAYPIGTASGIKKAIHFLGQKPFWVLNSDVICDYQIDRNFKLQEETLGHLVLVQNPPHHRTGDFNISQNRLARSGVFHNYTFSGISVVSPLMFDSVAEHGAPLEPLFFDLAKNKSLTGEVHIGKWLDVGNKERYLLANEMG